MDKISTSILVVEDSPVNIAILVNALGDIFNIYIAKRGKDVLGMLQTKSIDLILLDINLPDIDGFEVLKLVKNEEDFETIPVMFLSSITDPIIKTKCFELGAVDYISKPYNIREVRERVNTHVKLREANQLLSRKKDVLEEMVRIRTKEVDLTRDAAIKAVSSLVETRDSNTAEHINRTQSFVLTLAEILRSSGKFTNILTKEYIRDFHRSSVLHDIGKIGIPDNVLLKPGKLTTEEFEIIKTHPKIGYDALKAASSELGDNSFFDIACDIALYHHEKWNGTGYPSQLKGENIPIAARIMALSDVYDALTSERVYKKAFSHEKAVDIIISEKGEHFDPDVVDAFIEVENLFKKIAFQLT